jgi:galactokinase
LEKMMDTNERKEFLQDEFVRRFGDSPALFVQAPGRVDLMGSHTDYNLGYVLTQAIDRSTWIAARPRSDAKVRVASLNVEGRSEFSLSTIGHDETFPWTNYVRGVADIFQKEGYVLNGFDGLVHSTIPFGSGLSSSAALEVSTAVLFEALGDWRIDPVQMALLCQKAENEFVGMNCGILDQYSSVMGQEGSVLLLDCRSLTSETRPIAPGLKVMICDTRAERALTGSEYPERRAQCEQGAHILSGFYPAVKSLRDVTLEQLQAHKADMELVVYKRCKFILEENQRVLALASALAAGNQVEIGRLAVQSFQGARDLYEIVSREMIAMFDAIMSAPGILGARGAGAGFGGCLVAFVRDNQVEPFSQQVYERYLESTGLKPEIYPVQAAPGASIVS